MANSMEQLKGATRAWERHARHEGLDVNAERERALFLAGYLCGRNAGARARPEKEEACNT